MGYKDLLNINKLRNIKSKDYNIRNRLDISNKFNYTEYKRAFNKIRENKLLFLDKEIREKIKNLFEKEENYSGEISPYFWRIYSILNIFNNYYKVNNIQNIYLNLDIEKYDFYASNYTKRDRHRKYVGYLAEDKHSYYKIFKKSLFSYEKDNSNGVIYKDISITDWWKKYKDFEQASTGTSFSRKSIYLDLDVEWKEEYKDKINTLSMLLGLPQPLIVFHKKSKHFDIHWLLDDYEFFYWDVFNSWFKPLIHKVYLIILRKISLIVADNLFSVDNNCVGFTCKNPYNENACEIIQEASSKITVTELILRILSLESKDNIIICNENTNENILISNKNLIKNGVQIENSRHMYLLNKGQKYAFSFLKENNYDLSHLYQEDILKFLISENNSEDIKKATGKIEPLSNLEVKSIALSVYKFTMENYDKNFTPKKYLDKEVEYSKHTKNAKVFCDIVSIFKLLNCGISKVEIANTLNFSYSKVDFYSKLIKQEEKDKLIDILCSTLKCYSRMNWLLELSKKDGYTISNKEKKEELRANITQSLKELLKDDKLCRLFKISPISLERLKFGEKDFEESDEKTIYDKLKALKHDVADFLYNWFFGKKSIKEIEAIFKLAKE